MLTKKCLYVYDEETKIYKDITNFKKKKDRLTFELDGELIVLARKDIEDFNVLDVRNENL